MYRLGYYINICMYLPECADIGDGIGDNINVDTGSIFSLLDVIVSVPSSHTTAVFIKQNNNILKPCEE